MWINGLMAGATIGVVSKPTNTWLSVMYFPNPPVTSWWLDYNKIYCVAFYNLILIHFLLPSNHHCQYSLPTRALVTPLHRLQLLSLPSIALANSASFPPPPSSILVAPMVLPMPHCQFICTTQSRSSATPAIYPHHLLPFSHHHPTSKW